MGTAHASLSVGHSLLLKLTVVYRCFFVTCLEKKTQSFVLLNSPWTLET